MARPFRCRVGGDIHVTKDAATDRERALVDIRGARIGAGAVQRERAGADFRQASTAAVVVKEAT